MEGGRFGQGWPVAHPKVFDIFLILTKKGKKLFLSFSPMEMQNFANSFAKSANERETNCHGPQGDELRLGMT